MDSFFPAEVTLNNGDGTVTGAEITNHDTGEFFGSYVNVTINSRVDNPLDGFICGGIDRAGFVDLPMVKTDILWFRYR